MTIDQLNVIISAQAAGLRQELEKVKGQFQGVQQQVQGMEKQISASTGRVSGSLKAMGKAVLAAFSVRTIVNFGREAVAMASDLQEVENVVSTSFGDMTDEVNAWAKTTVDKFGLSELSAKRTASTYMAMSKGMGLAGRQAADMAMAVAERTGDIASFFNKTQAQADTMLKSIWTGETESLKQIGVVMTQTNLDAYALANGFGKTTDAMTQAEQVMLRYQYVMDQTSLAAGDFEKTSGSWANQTRVLSERFKELLAILGSGLIQVLTPLIQMLNIIVKRMTEAAQEASRFLSALLGGGSGVAVGAGSIAQDTGAIAGNMEEANKAAKELKKTIAGFDELNVLSDSGAISDPGLSIVSGNDLETLEKYKEAADEVRGALTIPEPVKKGWETIRTTIKGAFQAIKEAGGEAKKVVWDNFLVPLGEWAGGKFLDAVKEINEKLEAFGKWCEDNGITLEKLGDGLSVIASALSEIIQYMGDKIFEEWKKLMEDMATPIKETAASVSGLVTSLSGLIRTIEGLFGTGQILGMIFFPFEKAITTIRIAVSELATFLNGQFNVIISGWGGLFTAIQGVLEGDGKKVLKGIKNIGASFVNALITYLNLGIGAINTVMSAALMPFQAIAKALDAIPGVDVPEWVYTGPEIPSIRKIEVPALAEGGLASGPTMAMIGEGQYREAVLPLSQSVYAEIAKGISAQSGNTAVVNLLERLLRAVEAIDPTFELNLDDRGIARLANSGNKRLGYKVADVYG